MKNVWRTRKRESKTSVTFASLAVAFLLATSVQAELTGDWAIPADKNDFHVFLLMGQSNMAGYPTLQTGDDADEPFVLELRGELSSLNSSTSETTEWVRGAHRLHQVQSSANFGLGIEFARRYRELNPGVTVGLIPVAWGGAAIDQLNKGNNRYANAIQRAQFAQNDGVIKGVLWHQGESDSVTTALANSYAGKLDQLVADLRTDLEIPELPFVAGGLAPEYGTGRTGQHALGIPIVKAAIAGLPNRVTNTAYADPVDLTTIDQGPSGFVHFDRASLITLGTRYANALDGLSSTSVPEPTACTLIGMGGLMLQFLHRRGRCRRF